MPSDTPVILFDLDGTLVDTAPDLARALNHVLASAGAAQVSAADVRHMVGHGARKLIERGMAAGGRVPDSAETDALVARFLSFYGANIAVESCAFPDVEATLATLRAAGARLAVCTNKPENLSIDLLDKLNLTRFFDTIAGADTFPVRKPDPGHLLLTLERLQARTGPAVMVGDSETDIKAARAARLPVVAVTFGYTDRPVAVYSPDALIDRFDALIPSLTRLINWPKP